MEFQAIVEKVIEEVKPFTMVPPENLSQTIRLVLEGIDANRPGILVECGTWLGGSSFAMLLAQRYRYGKIIKPVWMFDSFEGLPAADDRDGPLALQYQRKTDVPEYIDNCRAPIEKVRAAIQHFQFSESESVVHQGWFKDTLPPLLPQLADLRIAVLRVDCDWYEPVFDVLQSLAPQVCNEGAIILDDYFAWDGCARATHDYLSHNKLAWRIRSMDKFYGAWMVKRSHRIDQL